MAFLIKEIRVIRGKTFASLAVNALTPHTPVRPAGGSAPGGSAAVDNSVMYAANGADYEAGKTYIVGEKGPEHFIFLRCPIALYHNTLLSPLFFYRIP